MFVLQGGVGVVVPVKRKFENRHHDVDRHFADVPVCNKCWDKSILKCEKCHFVYQLRFKGNKSLYGFLNGEICHPRFVGEMDICLGKGCNNYVCSCDKSERGRCDDHRV